jgi:uncharacterized Zn finger protein
MQKPRCPKCSSEEFEDDMIVKYGMWGELIDNEPVKKCMKCGEIIREGDKIEYKSA